MDLLEAYFQTTSGTWKALLIKTIAITQNLIWYFVSSIQGTLCCMDYSSCGHFGYVTHHSSRYGGWHGNSWSALFSSIHSWLSSGTFISKELKISATWLFFSVGTWLPAGGSCFYLAKWKKIKYICIKKGHICLLVLWSSLQFNICSNNFCLVFLLVCLGMSMLMSCLGACFWGIACSWSCPLEIVVDNILLKYHPCVFNLFVK